MGSRSSISLSFKIIGILIYSLLIISYSGAGIANASSEEAMSLYKQGNVWAEAKEFQKARTFYRDSIAADPKFAIGHNALGYVEYELGHYESAEAEYNEALRLDPNMAVTYNNLGILYYHKPAYDNTEFLKTAIEYYKKAVELKPNYAKAMVNMSVAYEKKGDLWNAFLMYQKAITTDPNYIDERKRGDNAKKEIQKIEEKYGTIEGN